MPKRGSARVPEGSDPSRQRRASQSAADRNAPLGKLADNSSSWSNQMTLGWGAGPLGLTMTAEPADPNEGQSALWMSNGTGYGSAGEIIIKTNVNGAITYTTLSGSGADDFVDGLTFNTDNGVLTASRTGSLADLTVDLDGRWITSEGFTAGAGLTKSGTQYSHEDTSSQAGTANSGRTYIQNVTLDGFGHVTGLVSATETEVKLTTEEVQDIVGAMFSSNTETRISATYQDGDGTIDLVVDDMTGGEANEPSFKTISVSGQDNVVAEADDDTLTLAQAGGITITTTPASDTITISSADTNTWRPVTAAGNTLETDETLAFTAGTGISIAEADGVVTITNTSAVTDTNTTYELLVPDGTTAIRLDPSTGDNDDVTITAGTGITVTRNSATEMTIGCTVTDTNTQDVSRYGISCVDGAETDEEIIRLSGTINGVGTTDDVILEAGTGLSIARSSDKITFTNEVTDTNTQLSAEEVQDFVGAMFEDNTETRISVTYDDDNGKINLVVDDMTADTTYSAGDGLDLVGTVFSHEDTSSQADVNNSGRTYIQDVTLDTFGHVTGLVSATETVVNTHRTVTAGGNTLAQAEPLAFTAGTGISITESAGAVTITNDVTDTNTNQLTVWQVRDGSDTFDVAHGDDVLFAATGAASVDVTSDGDVRTVTIGATDTNTDNYADSLAFDTSTGVLTVGLTGSLSDLTVDLDGRYLQSEGSDTTYDLLVPDGTTAIRLDPSTGDNDDITITGGANVTVTRNSATQMTIASTDTNTVTNAFSTVAVSGQPSVLADGTADTLTLANGDNVTITTNAGTDTVTISSQDTTYSAGDALELSGTTFNHANTSDQTGTSNTGRVYIQNVGLDAYGHVTSITTATETVTDTTYDAGDGLDLTGTTFSADLKANGGLVIESTEIAVDLGASNITGTLADADISSSANWNTAYGWGNHASAGYITTDTNTTYSISCVDGAETDEEIIRLTAGGSGSGTDDIVLEAGTGLSVARDGDKITFTNTATDTDNYVDSLAFATGTGILTVGRTGALADLTVDLDGRYLESETSHADVLVDSEFGSEGLMKRGGSAGTYSIVADASANWNTAYSWGDHASAGYVTTDTNTWRPVTAGGNTLGSSETLAFTAGDGVDIAESGGAVTISASDDWLKNDADDTTTGIITAAGFRTSGKIEHYIGTGPHDYTPDAGGHFIESGAGGSFSTRWNDTSTANGGTASEDFRLINIPYPTLTSTNGDVTTTNATTLYIQGSPINFAGAGSETTITNRYAIYVESGVSRFGAVEATYLTLNDTYLNNVLESTDTFIDHDFSLMTAGAIKNKIESYNYLTSETSHADVVVDGDFGSNGLMKRTGAGTYGIVADASANWNTAYGWGDHDAAGYQAALTFGIANTNSVRVDDADAADDDYAKFTATGIEGRSYGEVKTDLSLNNVENTALSTWAGTSNITTVGTIATGTWTATDVAILHGGTGASNASDARDNLGVDAAGTDNSPTLSIAAGLNYISAGGTKGHTLTLGAVDLADDVTGELPASAVQDKFLRNDGDDETSGVITAKGVHKTTGTHDYTPSNKGHFINTDAGSGFSDTWRDDDTANGGTAAEDFRLVNLGQQTLRSENGDVTTTNATTLYVAGPPVQTTDGSSPGVQNLITNAYSLWVDYGVSRFDSEIIINDRFTLSPYGQDPVTVRQIQTSSETFDNLDTTLMTAAAIADKIESYSYSTTTGTVTSVAINGVDGIDVDSGSPITSAGTITLGLSDIANDKLANSSVSYGGVSLSLGDTDATPAFNLQDATGYPTSSLTGTITNAQLDGSIANGKLANSTVTVGSTSIALGATQTAFAGLTSMQILGTTTVETKIAGITIDAAFVQKTAGGDTALTIEPSGRITSDSGLRCYGASSVLGPKGGGTVNFIANEGVQTLLNGGIAADSAVVTVDSTEGMSADDHIIFSAAGSDSTASADQNHGFTIDSVDSETQITLNTNAYTGSAPAWAADNAWVDIVGTGNMTFRNSNVNDNPSGAKRNLQFDYAGDSLGRNGGELKFRTYRRRTPVTDPATPTTVERLTVDADGKLEFNPEQKSTADFKASSSGSANMLVVDASEDRVGVNTGSPKATLHVNGSSAFHIAGKKSGNFTTTATQNIVTLRVNDDGETTATAPAAFEKGRVIRYVMHTVESGNTGWFTIAPNTGQQIEKNDEFGSTNDGTRGDQLKHVGEMITLIGSNTTDVWIAVKSGSAAQGDSGMPGGG